MFEVGGQTAIVTGAANGIGEVISRRLANAGARVAIADIDDQAAAEAAERIGKHAFPLHLDITDANSVRQAIETLLVRTQSLEIVVNNAGLAGKAAPVWEQTDDDWNRALAINVTGPFFMCRAVMPHMRSRRYGRVVNIASIAGKEGNPNASAYSAAKAGVIALHG